MSNGEPRAWTPGAREIELEIVLMSASSLRRFLRIPLPEHLSEEERRFLTARAQIRLAEFHLIRAAKDGRGHIKRMALSIVRDHI